MKTCFVRHTEAAAAAVLEEVRVSGAADEQEPAGAWTKAAREEANLVAAEEAKAEAEVAEVAVASAPAATAFVRAVARHWRTRREFPATR
jgi:hypothetical protein